MIVKMKKYGIVSYAKDFPIFLDSLQNLGLIDITQATPVEEGEERRILTWLNFCTEAIKRLETYKTGKQVDTETVIEQRKKFHALKDYQKTAFEYEEVDEEIFQRDKRYKEFLPWGEYDPKMVEELHKNGLELLFFTCDRHSFDTEWEKKYNLRIINELNDIYYFVITKHKHDEKIIIPANEIKMPNISLSKQKEEIDALKLRRDALDEHFEEMTIYLPTLYQERIRLQNALSFDQIVTGTETSLDDTVRITQGFIPEEKEADFLAFLDAEPVYYTALDIAEDEDIPILLKNNRFAKLYEPITRLFSLPHYKELDLTPFLAPFFMLFVGFCAGDAGYGLLLLFAATFAKRKLKADFRPICSLIQWLGGATILFGILSGNFFGIELAKVPALSQFTNFFLDKNNLMTLAFIFGGVHLIFAMVLNIISISRRLGFKYAVTKIGWLTLILSSAAVFGLPMMFDVMISETLMIGYYVVAGLCGLAIFFYNSPGKNPAVQFGSGLWTTYNTVTGLLGDFLSYVRLFALGLAGSILGMVFNQLAFDMSPDIPIVGAIVTLFILLFGHSLNFLLVMLGAFVHPLRLTFVEFYKNAGFQGGGREYKPFTKIKN